jgi:hypothetical protein
MENFKEQRLLHADVINLIIAYPDHPSIKNLGSLKTTLVVLNAEIKTVCLNHVIAPALRLQHHLKLDVIQHHQHAKQQV